MSDISDISSNLQSSVLKSLLDSIRGVNNSSELLKNLREKTINLPSVLDEDTLNKLRNGEYDISLKEYTSLNTYNSVMNTLYGNRSANRFLNLINTLSNSSEDNLANAKSLVDKLKEQGVTNKGALRIYAGLQQYSLVSSLTDNYNYVNTTV